MSKGRICSAGMTGMLGCLTVYGAAAGALAAPPPLGPAPSGEQPAPVTLVHYKGGSHCHPNCVLGQCRPVCHCKAGHMWFTVQGTSCRRPRASAHPLKR
jgi:hypothetical protein